MQPKVSIITVNFNGKRFLKDFFESLKNSLYSNFDLVFVDNASMDGSVAYVRENWPQVKIIDNQYNAGFSIANNNAAKQTNGEYLFFLNNDTKIHPETVAKLVERMELDPTIGICGCKMMSYDGKEHFHTGIGMDIFGFPTVNKKTFYIEGSALIIKRQLFEEIGGFDPQYFMFHEDIDLSWRIWLGGYRVVAIPEAIVYHCVGASAGGAAIKKDEAYKSTYLRRYLSERNNIRTLLKNYSCVALVLLLPIYFLLNILEITFFLLAFKPKVSLCYLKSYYWNLKHLRDTVISRRKIQMNRKVSDIEIIKKMHRGIGKILAFKSVKIPTFE